MVRAPKDADLVGPLEKALPEAVAVYLYGSVAAGQAGSASDIDLAVLAAEPIAPERLARARQTLAEAQRRDVDVLDLSRASTVMRAQVVSTGHLLGDADPPFREDFETTVYSAYASAEGIHNGRDRFPELHDPRG